MFLGGRGVLTSGPSGKRRLRSCLRGGGRVLCVVIRGRGGLVSGSNSWSPEIAFGPFLGGVHATKFTPHNALRSIA